MGGAEAPLGTALLDDRPDAGGVGVALADDPGPARLLETADLGVADGDLGRVGQEVEDGGLGGPPELLADIVDPFEGAVERGELTAEEVARIYGDFALDIVRCTRKPARR